MAEDESISIELPESVWRSMIILLDKELKLYASYSQEYRNIKAFKGILEDRTGLTVEVCPKVRERK